MIKPGFLLFIVGLVLLGCSSGSTVDSGTLVDKPWVKGFEHFPDSIYYGLIFDEPVSGARRKLEQQEFTLLDSSGVWNFYRQQDSAQVFLELQGEVHALKIILKSYNILSASDDLRHYFNESATSSMGEAEFQLFEYRHGNSAFKLTFFEQHDFVRLNFEQQLKK